MEFWEFLKTMIRWFYCNSFPPYCELGRHLQVTQLPQRGRPAVQAIGEVVFQELLWLGEQGQPCKDKIYGWHSCAKNRLKCFDCVCYCVTSIHSPAFIHTSLVKIKVCEPILNQRSSCLVQITHLSVAPGTMSSATLVSLLMVTNPSSLAVSCGTGTGVFSLALKVL